MQTSTEGKEIRRLIECVMVHWLYLVNDVVIGLLAEVAKILHSVYTSTQVMRTVSCMLISHVDPLLGPLCVRY